MDWKERAAALRWEAAHARWRVETIARVGRDLGMHEHLRLRGVRVLVESLLRGKANPSLIFRFQAANDPDRTAIIQAATPGKDGAARLYSYGELGQIIDRAGLAFLRRGVGRGTATLVLSKNRVEFLMIQPALNRIGARAVPASWRSTAPEIEYLAKHSGARAIVFDVDIADTIREVAKKLDIPAGNYIAIGGDAAGFPSLQEIMAPERGEPPDASEEGQLVMYTSGTTGKPKGATRRFQRDAMPAAMAFIGATPLRPGDVHLAACPVYHATAFGFMTFNFILGGTIVLMTEFRPEALLDLVQRYRVNNTALVPTMVHRVLDLGPEVIGRHDLSSLRAIFCTGSALDPTLANDAMDTLGDKLWNLYGSTETGVVTLASPADLRAAPGTIGRPISGNEIRLVDDQGHDVKEGGVGELYAYTPLMVEGYHADNAATRASKLDRFFSVGDLARRDADGRYFIEGRKRDMIISGGVNVYPVEVEAALTAHPAVAEAGVVGVPDREWGERVVAFVALRLGMDASPDDLKAHCRGRLSGAKVPRDFHFLERMPRNPTGKILKRELLAMLTTGPVDAATSATSTPSPETR